MYLTSDFLSFTLGMVVLLFVLLTAGTEWYIIVEAMLFIYKVLSAQTCKSLDLHIIQLYH
jgi:hypothetical protein